MVVSVPVTITWGVALPTIVAYGVTPCSFHIAQFDMVLSYMIYLENITPTGAQLRFNPRGGSS
jgi:hypothetical protein